MSMIIFLRSISSLESLKVSGDEATGIQIVRRALEEPCRRIAQNAGVDGSVIVKKVQDGKGAFGYNAESGEFADLIEDGVIDPTKVVRSAIENASSIAGLLITTECAVTDKQEEKDEANKKKSAYSDNIE